MADLILESAYVGDARVRDLTGVADGLQALLELLAQVGIGAVAVEGGAVHVGLCGKGFDVAVAASGMSPRSIRSIAARIFCSL